MGALLAAAAGLVSCANANDTDNELWLGSGQPWVVASEPTLILGAGETDREADPYFVEIMSVKWMADGRIVAVNSRQPPEVRVYSPDGELSTRFGGAGEGPGEFRVLADAFLPGGDTIEAYDPVSGRITRFTTDGVMLSSQQLGFVHDGGPLSTIVWGRFRDGTYYAAPNRYLDDRFVQGAWVYRPELWLGHGGEVRDTIATLRHSKVNRSGTGQLTTPLAAPRAATVVVGNALIHGAGDDFELTRYDREGTPALTYSREYQRRRTTEDEIARLVAAAQEVQPDAYDDRNDRPWEEVIPAYGRRLVVDALGYLWVPEFTLGRAIPRRWSVFAESGEFLGEVATPPRFRPTDIRRDDMTGVYISDLGVQSIRVYPLARGER